MRPVADNLVFRDGEHAVLWVVGGCTGYTQEEGAFHSILRSCCLATLKERHNVSVVGTTG